jgi:nitroreductase
MPLTDLMQARVSTRAFLSRPVPDEIVASLLSAARHAPSGTNIQPWEVHVVTGTARARVSAAVRAVASQPIERPEWTYDYYPKQWFEPYLSRRRACGWGLYGLLGIEKGNREAALAQELKNFDFFDAPVGVFLFIDRGLGRGSLLDCGMFLQNFMLAALEVGLATCPQAAWVPFDATVRSILKIDERKMLVCGMALGYPDTAAPVNRYRPGRIGVDEFTTWHSDAPAQNP